MENIHHPFNLYEAKKFANFLECIKEVEDTRVNRGLQHSLENIVVIAIFAMLGGADHHVAIAEFGKAHIDSFHLILTMPYGIPSHDTFSRVLGSIAPEQLSFWLTIWKEDSFGKENTKQIAIDGKEDCANGMRFVRALSCETNDVIGLARVPVETNEVPIAHSLLKSLNLQNVVVTADAIHAQKKNASLIAKKGGDYVLAVKKNQRQLYKDIQLYFDDILAKGVPSVDYNRYEKVEKSRNRIERRICIVTDKINWITQGRQWKSLRSIALIISYRTIYGKTTTSYRYFVTSLKADAELIFKAVRTHWSIENLRHRNLDINFESDHSTVRSITGSTNFAIIKDFALYLLLRSHSTISLELQRLQIACRFNAFVENIVNPGF